MKLIKKILFTTGTIMTVAMPINMTIACGHVVPYHKTSVKPMVSLVHRIKPDHQKWKAINKVKSNTNIILQNKINQVCNTFTKIVSQGFNINSAVIPFDDDANWQIFSKNALKALVINHGATLNGSWPKSLDHTINLAYQILKPISYGQTGYLTVQVGVPTSNVEVKKVQIPITVLVQTKDPEAEVNTAYQDFRKANISLKVNNYKVLASDVALPFAHNELQAKKWSIIGKMPSVSGSIVTFTVPENIDVGLTGNVVLHFKLGAYQAPNLIIKMQVVNNKATTVQKVRQEFAVADLTIISPGGGVYVPTGTDWENVPPQINHQMPPASGKFNLGAFAKYGWAIWSGYFPQDIPAGVKITYNLKSTQNQITLHFAWDNYQAPQLPLNFSIVTEKPDQFGHVTSLYPFFIDSHLQANERYKYTYDLNYGGEWKYWTLKKANLFINLNNNLSVKDITVVLTGVDSYGNNISISQNLSEYAGFVKGDMLPPKLQDLFYSINKNTTIKNQLGLTNVILNNDIHSNSYLEINAFNQKPILFNFYADGNKYQDGQITDWTKNNRCYWKAGTSSAKATYGIIPPKAPKKPETTFWQLVFGHPDVQPGDLITIWQDFSAFLGLFF